MLSIDVIFSDLLGAGGLFSNSKQPFTEFFKIGAFKNFVKLTGKYLCRSLSLITHRPAAFFKAGLRHSCFIVNFVNFFENNIFTEQLRTAASVFMECICNINKPHFI